MKKGMPIIAVLGSHSALDVCRGAKDEGFRTLVIAQKGREKTYTSYFKSCVDECVVFSHFSDILKLKRKNVVFIPHRSFEVYLHFDYETIEKKFPFPIFGNKLLLKIEERSRHPNQYELLKKADIRFPKQFKNPRDIDRLCLVKALHGFERDFFLVKNYSEYKRHTNVKSAIIEEFVAGTQVNFNFFYSVIRKRLELLGTDTRRQTSLDGILRLPAAFQKGLPVKYEEAGHIAVTVLESLLEDAFAMGERFVRVSRELFPPGIIGPFALQTIITPGPPKKEIIVFDVSPRMPGSPGIANTPYSGYLYGEPISMGRRIAMEIKNAVRTHTLQKLLT